MEKSTKTEFLEHYEPVHDQFYRFCRAISGNPGDTEDLMQDTILNVLEGFEKIRDLSLFKSYLFSVASNLCKMKQRRNKFRAAFNEEETQKIIGQGTNPEHLADFRIVYENILSLPRRTAETIILFHISDLSLEEIRKIQGGSLSGVKSRLQRGREKLISILNTPEKVRMAMLFLTL